VVVAAARCETEPFPLSRGSEGPMISIGGEILVVDGSKRARQSNGQTGERSIRIIRLPAGTDVPVLGKRYDARGAHHRPAVDSCVPAPTGHRKYYVHTALSGRWSEWIDLARPSVWWLCDLLCRYSRYMPPFAPHSR